MKKLTRRDFLSKLRNVVIGVGLFSLVKKFPMENGEGVLVDGEDSYTQPLDEFLDGNIDHVYNSWEPAFVIPTYEPGDSRLSCVYKTGYSVYNDGQWCTLVMVPTTDAVPPGGIKWGDGHEEFDAT